MLLWVDIESSGLNPVTDDILEIGIIVTTDDLVERLRWSSPVTWSGDRSKLDPVVQKMHLKNGLFDECAQKGRSLEEITSIIIPAVKGAGVTEGNLPPLAGSSVHFDRAFLSHHAPAILKLCSYRNVNVLTVTELCKRWHPAVYAARPGRVPSENAPHRALADLDVSITTLRYYRKELFVKNLFKEGVVAPDPATLCRKATKRVSHYGNPILCSLGKGHKEVCK